MVEMKTGVRSTLRAAPLVPLPDLQLDPTRNETIIFFFTGYDRCPVIATHIGNLKLEFENLTVA